MRKEKELLYITIKKHRVACLIRSFLSQARYHYFEKYQNAYLDSGFIDDIATLENNFERIIENLSSIRFEELDLLERTHCDIMTKIGMNTDTPPFDKSVYGQLRTIEDVNVQHFLQNVWQLGNNDLRQLVLDYIDRRIDIKFDLSKTDNRGKLTVENGKSVYHLPAEVQDFTQKNYTNNEIMGQALHILSTLSALDNDTSTHKVLSE